MNDRNIPFLDLGASYGELQSELDDAYRRVMESGWYLLGAELAAFEDAFATYTGAKHCAGVASGLDALVLGLRALDVGPGDEVIVPSNTFIATWLAVSAVGAIPVPVEPDRLTCNITGDAVSEAITSRTAAVVPVHLYGLPADVDGIERVVRRHGLPVFYDAAQAHGARYKGRPLGEFGDLAAWSFYPGKNLGAFADGGALTGRDPQLVDRVRRLRNYGSEVKYLNLERGVNSRLDELQAAFLSVKLRHLDAWNERRRSVASIYAGSLGECGLQLPIEPDGLGSAWHLYVVQADRRDELQSRLAQRGIQSLVHYPIPPHRQAAYADHHFGELPIADRMAHRLLSLPIGPHMSPGQAEQVAVTVRELVGAMEGAVPGSTE